MKTSMRIVLDSTFVIDHLRGDAAAVRRLHRMFEDGDEPYCTEVVVCEVRAGLRPDDVLHLEGLLEPVEFVQPGIEVAMTAGAWRAASRAAGRTLSLGDALIAASAHAVGATVLTRNVRDFALTPVTVESY